MNEYEVTVVFTVQSETEEGANQKVEDLLIDYLPGETNGIESWELPYFGDY